MGRMANFIMLFSGIMLVFYFFGGLQQSSFLTLLLNPASLSTSEFYKNLTGALIVGIGGIIIGAITRNLELGIMVTITGGIALILWDILMALAIVGGTFQWIPILLFSPLLLLFAITVIDYWRGRD